MILCPIQNCSLADHRKVIILNYTVVSHYSLSVQKIELK
jgi:hypothetical protein